MIHCWVKFRSHKWVYFKISTHKGWGHKSYRVCRKCSKIHELYNYIEPPSPMQNQMPITVEVKKAAAKAVREHDIVDDELERAVRER